MNLSWRCPDLPSRPCARLQTLDAASKNGSHIGMGSNSMRHHELSN
jgi:hypothetical protein